MNNIPDKKELEKALRSFTPAEEKYRNYYREKGVLCPFDSIQKDVQMYEQEKYLMFAGRSCGVENVAGTFELSENVFRDVEDVAIAKHPRYSPEFVHRHNFFEIVYVLSGKCKQTICSSVDTESIECNQGDLLILPPSILHSILVKDDNSIILDILMRKSSFDKAFLHNIPDTTLLADFFTSILYSTNQSNYVLFRTAGSEIIRELIFDIYLEYNKAQPYFNVMMNLQLAQLFMYLLRNHSDAVSFTRAYPREMDYIPIIIQFMENNYSWITAQDIANHVGFSTSHLGRIFKKYTKKTVSQYLREIRMCKAVNYLIHTTKPVEEIAAMVGYMDTTNFIRRFKDAYGQTPKQYRLKHNKVN